MRTPEERIAWAGSVALHAALALAFWLIVVRSEVGPIGLIEVQFGPFREGRPVRAVPQATAAFEAAAEATAGATQEAAAQPAEPPRIPEPPARPVEAPRQPPLQSPERIQVPTAPEVRPERSSPEPSRSQPAPERSGQGSEVGMGRVPERAEGAPASGGPEGSGKMAEGSPGAGLDPDRAAPFLLVWDGNIARSILRQRLPEYPVKVEAEIRIRFTVDPQGRVISMIPLQKGPPELERAAMQALREWRFNPLPAYMPQLPQSGVITFRFRLE